jgi:NDP-sugar pyrophosphorylase family protein
MLMKAVLISPGDRSEVPFLMTDRPLSLVPALGQTMLEYWLSHVAGSGVKQVIVLTRDHVDEIRTVAREGARWGVTLEVIVESWEMTPEQASEKYGAPAFLMDRFPGLPAHSLFDSYGQWFRALVAWMPCARTPDRVGAREVSPGVWVGLHSHISPEARLCAPCWVGDHVYAGPGAVIGPEAIVEDGAFIEANAEIGSCVIGPATYVGEYVQINNTLVAGNTLVNWKSGLESTVSDAFLLCSLERRRPQAQALPMLDRIAEWLDLWKAEPRLEAEPLMVKRES